MPPSIGLSENLVLLSMIICSSNSHSDSILLGFSVGKYQILNYLVFCEQISDPEVSCFLLANIKF